MNYSIPDNPRGRHTKTDDEPPVKPSLVEAKAQSESIAAEEETVEQAEDKPSSDSNDEVRSGIEEREVATVSEVDSSVTESPEEVTNQEGKEPEIVVDEIIKETKESVVIDSVGEQKEDLIEDKLNKHDLLGQQFFEQTTNMSAQRPKKVPLALAHIQLKEELALEQAKISEFRDLMVKARDSIGDVREENRLYKEQNQELRDMLTQANEHIKELESKNAAMAQESKIDPEIGNKNAQLEEKVEDLENELSGLQDQKRELQASRNALHQALEDAENQVKNWMSDGSAKESISEDIATDTDTSDSQKELISQLQDRNRELQAMKNALTVANESLEGKLNSVSNEVDADENSLAESTQELIQQLQDRNRELMAMRNALAASNESLEAKIKDQSDISPAKAVLEEDTSAYKEQISQLTDKVREFQAMRNALAASNESLEETIKGLNESSVPESGEDSEELNAKVQQLSDRIRELQAMKNAMSSAMEDLESKLLESAEESDSGTIDSAELDKLKEQVDQFSDRLRESQAMRNALIASNESLEEKLKELTSSSSSADDPLLKEQLGQLTDKVREFQAMRNALVASNESLEAEVKELSSHSCQESSEGTEELKVQIEQLSDRNRELQAMKNAMTAAMEELEAKLSL